MAVTVADDWRRPPGSRDHVPAHCIESVPEVDFDEQLARVHILQEATSYSDCRLYPSGNFKSHPVGVVPAELY